MPLSEVGIGGHGLGPEEENGLRNGLGRLRPVWRPRTGFGGNYRWPRTEVGRPAPAHSLKTEEIKMLAKSG